MSDGEPVLCRERFAWEIREIMILQRFYVEIRAQDS